MNKVLIGYELNGMNGYEWYNNIKGDFPLKNIHFEHQCHTYGSNYDSITNMFLWKCFPNLVYNKNNIVVACYIYSELGQSLNVITH